jgi:hypothetical protein
MRRLGQSSISKLNNLISRNLNTVAYDEDLFRYTSGRWLCNEQTGKLCNAQDLLITDTSYLELSFRSKQFDIEALKRVAAKAVGANSCNKFEKFAEGMFMLIEPIVV